MSSNRSHGIRRRCHSLNKLTKETQPSRDSRLGEALSLEWAQVRLEPAMGARFGYVTVLSGKAKNKKARNIPLSERVVEMLTKRKAESGLVFARANGEPLSKSRLDQQHLRIRKLLEMPTDFVLHSLRHTFGTRLGESGAAAFTIMKLMGHSTVTVSQRYVHPSPETIEIAYERLMTLNRREVPTNAPTPDDTQKRPLQQVV